MSGAEISPRRGFKAADYIMVWTRDGGICKLCGQPVAPTDISIDHILPHSRGGPHELDNWQLAHKVCNFSKGAKVGGTLPPRPSRARPKGMRRSKWPPAPAAKPVFVREQRAGGRPKASQPASPVRLKHSILEPMALSPQEYAAAFELSRLGYESESFLRFCEQTGLDTEDATHALVRQLVPFTVTGGRNVPSLWLPERAVDVFLEDHPDASPWPLSRPPDFIGTLDKLIYKRTGQHDVAFAPYFAYHYAHPPTQPTYAHRMLCLGCAQCRPQDAVKPADAPA